MKYTFSLERNVHMYNHLLTCTYGNHTYQASCESAVTREATIIFRLGEFGLPPEEEKIMTRDFIEWVKTQGFKYVIYGGKGR